MIRDKRFLSVAAVLCLSAMAAMFAPKPATAFPAMHYWHLAASGETNNNQNRAGADGLYGSGGPHDFGIQCVDCHIDAPGNVDLAFDFAPTLGTSGNDATYSPGQTYVVTVTMTGESLTNPNNPNMDTNLFVATFEDDGGNVMGSLTSDTPNNSSMNCPPTWPSGVPNGTTFVYGDCHGILAVQGTKLTQWTFSWQAPGAGAGNVTMWYGGVDGDTSGDSSQHDDTVQGSLFMIEGS
jgi:hypothetical protein